MKSNFRCISFALIASATSFAGAAAHGQSAFTEIGHGTHNARFGPGNPTDASGMRYALYIFEGEAGRRVRITLAATDFTPAIALYRLSDGSTIGTAHGQASATISAVLDDDGLYILSVTPVGQTYTSQPITWYEGGHKGGDRISLRFEPDALVQSWPEGTTRYRRIEPDLYEFHAGNQWLYFRVIDATTLEWFRGEVRKKASWPSHTFKVNAGRYAIELTSEDATSAGTSAAPSVARIYALQNGDQKIVVRMGNGTMTVALPGGRPAVYKQIEPNLYEISSTASSWLYFRVVDPNTLEWFGSRVRGKQDRRALVYKANTGQSSAN